MIKLRSFLFNGLSLIVFATLTGCAASSISNTPSSAPVSSSKIELQPLAAGFSDISIVKRGNETDKWLGWWEGPWIGFVQHGALFVHSVTMDKGTYHADVSYWWSSRGTTTVRGGMQKHVLAKINKDGIMKLETKTFELEEGQKFLRVHHTTKGGKGIFYKR